jgi:hypothetical protein
MKAPILLITILALLHTSAAYSQTYTFDFSQGDNEFIGGVSDFGVEQSEQHEFTFDNRPLPSPIEGENAQYMSGINPSDDLFMYMKRHITGLQPNATYEVTFTVTFASIYPTNAIGVGGPPGEGVTMKAGVTVIEPDTFITQKGEPFIIMNIDKGNQSQPGLDMDTIGHVGVSDTTTVYTIKTNDNVGSPFSFSTDASGEAWVIVGTDSGFEATTSLYYTDVVVEFSLVSSDDDVADDGSVRVYPNPSDGLVTISKEHGRLQSFSVHTVEGKLIVEDVINESSVRLNLADGIYVIRVIDEHGKSVVKRIVVQ